MRHRVKKIKFRSGNDANQMLMRKLITNFLLHGKITSVFAKVKALKPQIEKIVEKAKKKNKANECQIMKIVLEEKARKHLFDTVGPAVKSIQGGYVKIVKLGKRIYDGSEMARLEWAYPIVTESKSPRSIKSKSQKSVKSESNTIDKKIKYEDS